MAAALPMGEPVLPRSPALLLLVVAALVGAATTGAAAPRRPATQAAPRRAKPPAPRAPHPAPTARPGRSPSPASKIISPALWRRVHAELTARPAAWYPEIAATLNGDAAFGRQFPGVRVTKDLISKLIKTYDSTPAVAAAREQALVEQVRGHLAALPSGLATEELFVALAKRVPHLSRERLRDLRERHGEALGLEVTRRGPYGRYTPEVAARTHALALEHPSLSTRELAALFQRDPALAHLDWTENTVQLLSRRAPGAMPTRAEREAALARAAATIWAAQPAHASVEARTAAVAAAHPGFSLRQLERLARREPALRRALAARPPSGARRGPEGAAAQGPPPGPLDVDGARALRLTVAHLEHALGRRASPLRRRAFEEIAAAERDRGDNDGRLAPRDLDGAGELAAAAMDELYAKGGRRTLPLDRVRRELPAALAALARRGREGEPAHAALFVEAAREALDDLGAGYDAEVLRGHQSASTFAASRGVDGEVWASLRARHPERFPDPGAAPLDRARVDKAARLYERLLAGEISTLLFYFRSGISAEQVRVLQAAEPARFPRPPGARRPYGLPASTGAPLAEAELVELGRRWRGEVVTRRRSAADFRRELGLGDATLRQLQRARPGEFPRIPRGALQPGYRPLDEATARTVGERASARYGVDPLMRVEDVVAELNADPAFVERHGPMDAKRYGGLRRRFPDRFPDLLDARAVDAALAAEVRTLLDERPGLAPRDVLAEMRARHPRFNRARLLRLRGQVPALAEARAPAPRARAGAGAPIGARELGRSHAAAELWALAVRVAPPGTSAAEVGRVYRELLAERGVSTPGSRPPAPSDFRTPVPALEERSAQLAAAVVAEYARAAPRGATEQELLARVARDYPTLDAARLGVYRRRWSERPEAFPALAALRDAAGALRLRGLGRPPARPRYLGGWSVERALFGGDAAEQATLVRGSQFARLPLRLPLLDEMVRDLGGRRPLDGKHLLWVTHLLGTHYPLSRALRAAGASAHRTVVVGSPYGTNEAVRDAMVGDGLDVRVPALTPTAYRDEVRRALDDVAARQRRDGRTVIVLDDGGQVAALLHDDPRYADVRDAFKIVEQTTRGIDQASRRTLEVPVINVARSEIKRTEGAAIGRAVAGKVLQGLARQGRALRGADAVVIGYGVVGSKVARQLRDAGARVTVVESSPARAAEARRVGLPVGALADSLPHAQVVIGATGATSLGLESLRLLPDGAVVASASSKQVEIDMDGLARAASRRTPVDPGSPLVRLPTARYRLGRASITVLGDGWPVNFDGDVEDVSPTEIESTRAAMLAGALQAASLRRSATGLVPLDPETDRRLVDRFRALERARGGSTKPHAISDPSRWSDAVREVAERLSAKPRAHGATTRRTGPPAG